MAQGPLPLRWRWPRIAPRSSTGCPHRPPIRISEPSLRKVVPAKDIQKKKGATQEASGRRRLVLMRHYVGIDVGKGAHWVCVLDAEGEVILPARCRQRKKPWKRSARR
jgi:hypothetical protein